MLRADIAKGLGFCRDNGWNQTASDWEQLLALGGNGCVVAEVGGAVVGTLTSVRYEQRFAWIGMVLVERAMRGRGIATALMDHALWALGDVPARLDATPAGQPVYARLGFVEESRFQRMTMSAPDSTGTGNAGPERRSRPMTATDLEAILARDREVFGADRAALLTWAFCAAPGLSWIVSDGPSVRGYCCGRAGHHWSQIGPVAADSLEVGLDLVSSAAGCAHGPILVDAASTLPEWTACLASLGFVEQRPFARMRRGGTPVPPGRLRELAIFGPEWG